MKKLFLSTIFFCILSGPFFARNIEQYTNISSGKNYLIENKGQWNKEILFLAEANGMHVWVTSTELVFDFYKVEHIPFTSNSLYRNPKSPADSQILNGHVVKLKIKNPDVQTSSQQEIVRGEALSQYLNYFTGNDKSAWASEVRLFKSVVIKNYIPGVDLRLYFDDTKFRYDLVIQPGTDPNKIELLFDGEDALNLSEDHLFFIKTSIGEISHSDLNCYQEISGQKNVISSAFRKISDHGIGFNISHFDSCNAVVIDPLVYSSYLGGGNYDWGYDLDIDGSGNAFVGGVTFSTNFPTTTGAYRRTAYGSYDIFVSKFNSSGTALLYSTYLGGWGVEYLNTVKVDGSGNCLLAGYTGSSNYPTVGAYQNSLSGSYDAMITKINSNGTNLIFSTFIGGSNIDYANDIDLDASNNVYICGTTYSSNYPTSSSGYQRTYQGGYDGFITKMNSSASTIIFSTLLGGSNIDYLYSMDLDASGNVYVTGMTASSNFPKTTGCYQSSLSGSQDAFVTKLNSTGSALIYSTFLGGNQPDQGNSITVGSPASPNDAIVTGSTNSSNFPTTSGAYKTSAFGSADGFVTMLNTNGTAIKFSTYVGGNGNDNPSRVVIDQNNYITVAGYTSSTNLQTTTCALQSTNGGGGNYDVFACVFNLSLNTLLYSTYFGGNSIEYANGLAIDANGDAYITGYTYSTNMTTTSTAYQKTSGGYYDAFVIRFPYIALAMNGTIAKSYCAGTAISMPFIAGCTYSAGNVFTIQLSNSTGSFASPVTLGSASRQTSGTINCYIPKNIASGSGYRMRLISSNPYFVTADNGFNIRINSSPVTQYTVNNPTQCFSNNNFIFNNTSTIASGSMTYLWKFGDNTTTNQSNPTHSYSNDSNYVVKLICTSDSGCKDSLSKNLQIYSSPKTGFSVNDFAQCLDNNVFYFNSTTSIKQGSFTILWNFGDGDTSKQNTPSHTYKTNNNFNVKLTAVSNNGCKDSTTKTMKILPSPVSQFSINDTGQCLSSNNFIFTNKTSILQGNISYLWHFGDGATSAAINPSHSYSIPSNYVVELIATSDSGCKDTFSQQIRLAALPSAGFSINTTPQCIKENKFILTNSSSVAFGTVKYLWDFGNGTTDTIKDPVYSYKTEGNYTIQLITTASVDCADTISKTVTVNPSPSTSFSINDSDQCFNGNNFIFTNTSTIKSGSLTYQWNFGDASTANGTNASHSFSVDQNFKVKLVSLSDLGCKDSITKNALIYSSPKSDYFVNDSDQCFSNNSFSFTNTSNIKTGSLKFRWLYGDSKSDTMRNPVHAYAKYGNYNVSLISTSNKNCRDTIIKMIYVYPLPVAGFSINNPVQCLKGNHFVFSNSSLIPSGSMTYRWAFGDGFQSTDTDPDHSYLAARTYDVFLYATSLFGCSDTFKSTVTVNMMPKANFTLTTICLNEPVAFTDRSFINAPDSIILWSWDFGDGSVSSDRNPSYIFSNSGTTGVRLIVTSNNGCRDTVSKPIYIRPHVSAPVIDRVSVREGVSSDIEIEWIPPKDGYIKNYLLEKSEDNFNYTVFSHPDRLATGYIDASVLTDSMPYYFRIKAIDSCSYGSDYSNYGKSILLHTSNKIHIAELKWTAYEEWAEGIDHYEIELFNTKNSSFIYVGSVDANTLEFFDDVTALNQSDYCYRVAAVRNNDGVKCYSNSDCVPVSFGCFIPNSFTPNGDSLNDVLLAVGTSVFKFTLSIYDRWGNLVFESNDMSIGWDGTHNGTKSPEGYYYYQMSARGIKNQKTVSKGSILLIR